MKFEIATRCVAANKGQDRVFARIFDDVTIVALADGSGGRAGGGEAAKILVAEASKVAQDVRDPRDAKFWALWLEKVDELIRNDPWAGETTAVIVVIGFDYVAGASVGDSAAWLIGADGWIDLTQAQVQRPFLGSGGAIPRAFLRKLGNETVLLGSDGLTKYADAEVLAQIVRSNGLEVGAEFLIEAVRNASGSLADDVSCVLCRVSNNTRPEVGQKTRKKFWTFRK